MAERAEILTKAKMVAEKVQERFLSEQKAKEEARQKEFQKRAEELADVLMKNVEGEIMAIASQGGRGFRVMTLKRLNKDKGEEYSVFRRVFDIEDPLSLRTFDIVRNRCNESGLPPFEEHSYAGTAREEHFLEIDW